MRKLFADTAACFGAFVLAQVFAAGLAFGQVGRGSPGPDYAVKLCTAYTPGLFAPLAGATTYSTTTHVYSFTGTASFVFDCQPNTTTSTACAICVEVILSKGDGTTYYPIAFNFLQSNIANCGTTGNLQNVTVSAPVLYPGSMYQIQVIAIPYTPGQPCADASYVGGTPTVFKPLTP